MNANEPGLFEMSNREPGVLPEPRLRGRSREVWTRTVTAEVTVVDLEALRQAAVQADASALTIELLTDPYVKEAEAQDLDAWAEKDVFDALAWLLWPVDGLEGPVESGAFRILSADTEAVAESGDRGILTWTVTVKLTDVRELRRLAAEAHPEEEGLIADSLAVAWQHAADPLAPLRSIPGITWRSVQVEVQHLPRRVNRDR